jgi:hypothetical protein
VAQQKATGAFMQIVSQQGGRLVQASSPVAAVVEIHEMTMENNVMKMRAIPGLDLPAGKPVDLKPGGYHVMLMDLKPLLSGLMRSQVVQIHECLSISGSLGVVSI